MLTGYPLALGPGGLPLKFKTMANHLKEVGYSTHMVGKASLSRCGRAPRFPLPRLPPAVAS